MMNATVLIAFSLSRLNDTTVNRLTLTSLTVLCFSVILLVNGALIVTIILDNNLHEPMYIFLCNLFINSLYGTAAFYPKFLFDLLSNTHVISYTGCLLQVLVIYSYAATDFSILAVMAYDRYVAICRPLEYQSVMTKQRAVWLACFSRLVPLFLQTIVIIMTLQVELCGSHIEKLYCENWSILKLSCNSITTHNVVGFIIILYYFGQVLYIICSYILLVKSALKSREGWRKFMQTCVPHLLCLLNVTVAMLFDVMYARYGSSSVSQSAKNFMAIQFLIIPPILNPIIYGLKLTQIRKSFLNLCRDDRQVKGLG
ncbi:olfactory receptor 13D1-like [Centropristis striata]|uniref:olfactory receptor 13D1-like n=1 Tax=Centropristis striata TaxID=184440 RepID=UPI0027DEAEE3|nr:olfactory receptor 13D1-like [Centropristis striata]